MTQATITIPGPAERLRRLLSFSEVQCVQALLQVVPADGGTVVNSALCDQLGITRSVMVNGLRVCEAAGVLETRSLGVKGTHIRFHDRAALEQAVAS